MNRLIVKGYPISIPGSIPRINRNLDTYNAEMILKAVPLGNMRSIERGDINMTTINLAVGFYDIYKYNLVVKLYHMDKGTTHRYKPILCNDTQSFDYIRYIIAKKGGL